MEVEGKQVVMGEVMVFEASGVANIFEQSPCNFAVVYVEGDRGVLRRKIQVEMQHME